MTRLISSTPYGTTSFDENWKIFYDGMLQSAIPHHLPLVDYLKKAGSVRKIKPKGSQINFGLELMDGNCVGYRGENGAVPASGSPTTKQGVIHYRRGIKGRIGLSLEAIKYGKDDSVFGDVVKQETKSLLRQAANLAAASMWGNGDGLLAYIAQITTSATAVPATSETYNTIQPGVRWLFEGLSVYPCQSSASYALDGTLTAAKTIIAIVGQANITLSASVSTAGARYLVEHQTADTSTDLTSGSVTLGTGSSWQGSHGLCNIVGTAAFAGLDPATYPNWGSVVDHNTGTARALSTDLIYKMFGKLMYKAAGEAEPKVEAWMNFDMVREIQALMEPFVQFSAREFKPGFQKFDLMVNGVKIPINVDNKCPGFIFFLDPEALTMAEGIPLSVDDTSGVWRPVSNQTNHESFYVWQFQLYSTARNRLGVIKDISYTPAYL